MPELPEVETVCRGLQKPMAGQTIATIETRRKNLRIPFPADLSPDEKLPATGQDAVGIAFGSRPAGRLNNFMHGSLFHESQ